MRTTLVIDDDVLVAAKKLAADRRTSLSALVVEALRGFMARHEDPSEREPFRMPTFDGGGSTDSSPADLRELEAEGDLDCYGR